MTGHFNQICGYNLSESTNLYLVQHSYGPIRPEMVLRNSECKSLCMLEELSSTENSSKLFS